MVVCFAGGGSTVVAGFAVIGNALVIKFSPGECRCGMAGRAILGSRNMSRVGFRILASRRNTVVTGGAVINNTGMTEYCWLKSARHVTDTAILDGRYVRRVDFCIFAGCIDTIMAGVALTTDDVRIGMIDKGIGKISRVVAQRAITTGILMNGRIGFTNGPGRNIVYTAIMAGGAITADANMLKGNYRGCKRSNRVANVTILGCG